MTFTPMDDKSLVMLAGLIVGMVCFALFLFAIVVIMNKSVASQLQGTRIWPYISLVVCAMVILLLGLRGVLTSEIIAGLIGALLAYAFGWVIKKKDA